jgi:RNA binding exosome subunit
MLFHRLCLEAFCHATEDLGKVKEAMLNLLPPELVDSARSAGFKEQKLEGSFGNEITLVRLELGKQGDMGKAVERFKESLPKEDVEDFNVDEHVTDDGEFWMRFDKQEAYGGKIVLGGQDTIQLKGKVAAFPAGRGRALALMEEFWG